MAKWKSALFSDIRNKLGDQVTFSSWKGRGYMRAYVIPANPKTLAQKAHRDVLKKAMADGQAIIGKTGQLLLNKTEWNKAALDELISGFNLYMKDCLGCPIKGDSYSALAITKVMGENLVIPRGDVRIGVSKAGVMTTHTPSVIGGVAPAWEILKANLTPAWTPAAADKIYVMDNRIFIDSAVEVEEDAKATSHYWPNEATGVADEMVLIA